MYTPLFRPLLFRLDPETAHRLTINLLRLAGILPPVLAGLKWFFAPAHTGPEVNAFGLTFPNPVGLAAGYDKEGEALKGLASLGFGHLEIGTVTSRPQPGNPHPRVFRIPAESAVINRMGFPSQGAGATVARLRRWRNKPLISATTTHGNSVITESQITDTGSQFSNLHEAFPPEDDSFSPNPDSRLSTLYSRLPLLGINLGKNKATPLEEAALDYQSLLRTFAPLADYLAINVSSPNTPGLRQLQSRASLTALLGSLATLRRQLAADRNPSPPILVKLAPDLSWEETDDALTAIQDTGMDGVIATNTTLARDGLASPIGKEAGGLSGQPLKERSTQVIQYIYRHTEGKLPIIGVGGIMTPQDARAKLDAGAVLVQLYTGLVYAGPGLVKEVLNALNRG